MTRAVLRNATVNPHQITFVAQTWQPAMDGAGPAPEASAMTKTLLIPALMIAALGGFALADNPADKPADKPMAAPKPVSVTLKDAAGKTVGTAKLTQARAGGVQIAIAVRGLEPGEHAVHIHETAKCEGPDFKSAGPHFNPEHKKHGKDNPDGAHAGDLPNIKVNAKGGATTTLVASGVTLGDGDNSVFANGGTALVIHAKPDDNKTDPAGAAGDRIACGLILKK